MTSTLRSRIACALLSGALVLLPAVAAAREVRLQGPNGDGGACPEASIEEPDALPLPQGSKRGPVREKQKAAPMVRGGDATSRPLWHSILPGMIR